MAERKLQVTIVGDSKNLERSLARASKATKGFGADVTSAARSVRTGLLAAGAAVAGIGAVTSRAFAPFEETLDRVVGLAGGVRQQVDGFAQEILKLGPEVAKSPQELAEALYNVASAGIEASRQMGVVTAAAKASAAGLGETNVVADAVTSAMAAYGQEVITAQQATDVLVATVREGKGEAEAFAPVIGNVAALAAQLGVSFNEVGAALAAQTRLGTDARTASVQLQQVFTALLRTTPKAAKAFEAVGLNADDLREQLSSKGLLSVLNTLETAFAGNTKAMAQAFPEIRALRGVLSLVGKNADDVEGVFRRLNVATGSLEHAFESVSEGEAFKFRQTLASLRVTAIRLGGIFAPVAKAVADGANAALGVVNDLLARLGEARTIRAKLQVIWEGAAEAASDAQSLLTRAVRAIDFASVFAEARGIADGFQARLEEIDFGVVGERIGDGITRAVEEAIPATKELARRISDAVAAIDFEALGKRLGPGLAAAVVTAFTTLADPAFWIRNWDLSLAVAATVFRARIATFAARLLAPLRGVGASIVLGIAGGIERVSARLGAVFLRVLLRLPAIATRALAPLVNVTTRVFNRLGRVAQFTIRVLGIQAAINVVVRFVERVAGIFSGFGESLKKQGYRIALAILEPFSHLPGGFGEWARDAKEAVQKQMDEMAVHAGKTARAIQSSFTSATDAIAAADAAATAADNSVLPPKAKKPPAPTTITTPKTGPAPEAAQQVTAVDKAAQGFEKTLDRLRLAFEKAEFSGSLQRQLAALKAIATAIRERMKVTKDDVALERELLGVLSQQQAVRQQITQRRRDAAKAQQFEALGLTDTGEPRVAGIGAIRNRGRNLIEQLKSSGLDPAKIRAAIKRISVVFTDQFDNAGREIRQAILDMYASIAGAFEEGSGAQGPLTKFTKGSAKNLLRNVQGLTAEQIKALKQNFSQFGPGGTVPRPGGVGGAFGLGFAMAGGSESIHIYIDGREVEATVTRRQEKKRENRAPARRGTRAGRGL